MLSLIALECDLKSSAITQLRAYNTPFVQWESLTLVL